MTIIMVTGLNAHLLELAHMCVYVCVFMCYVVVYEYACFLSVPEI